jgi:hypothetical protein
MSSKTSSRTASVAFIAPCKVFLRDNPSPYVDICILAYAQQPVLLARSASMFVFELAYWLCS